MRIISFNVNGLRSMLTKTKNGEKTATSSNHCLKTLIQEQAPHILCLQEIKTQSENDILSLHEHFPHIYMYPATSKKGYSGVALLSLFKPDFVSYGFHFYEESDIGNYRHCDFNEEGRIITAKYSTCIVITVYTPNSKPKLARIDERLLWERTLRLYIRELEKDFELPIILCGDLNCALKPIDIHQPKQRKDTPGYSEQEHDALQTMLDYGFTDSFRYLYPDQIKYSWWDMRSNARVSNKGWRIDYLLVSRTLQTSIEEADCLNEYYGSDHCPVLLGLSSHFIPRPFTASFDEEKE